MPGLFRCEPKPVAKYRWPSRRKYCRSARVEWCSRTRGRNTSTACFNRCWQNTVYTTTRARTTTLSKAAVIERLNRTLKERIYRYFTYKNTWRYIDVLNDIVYSYNYTYHRSIGKTPSQVDKENEHIVCARLYPEKSKRFKYRFNIGDTVRMNIRRNVFHKSYSGSWSEEIFTVCSRHPTQPVTYSLKDAADQPIKGRFYECETQSHKTRRRLLRCRQNTQDAKTRWQNRILR
jgi:hypothetical protein